jgi:FMN phosphatase YigB (HAD superfamily)
MTSLRIGFDMDGVLADFARAYRDVERRLFGQPEPARIGSPEDPGEEERADTPAPSRGRRDAVWTAIRETRDFWETLEPIEKDAVRRIDQLMRRYRWEVFFITQRPATDGDTVQRQTQRWLVAQGFDLPSVLVINGPRGAAAGALSLHYHVDDNAAHCIDVKADSPANPIQILEDDDRVGIACARSLGIATVPGIGAALDLLERASDAQARPTILKQLAQLVGWQ